MKKTKIYLMMVSALVAFGCAKTVTTSTNEQDRQYLEDWLKRYPDVKEMNGLYLLSETEGTGEAWDASNTYAFIQYAIRSLSGTVSSNGYEDLAKQLQGADFSDADYYGPRAYAVGEGLSYAGFDRILSGMKAGGKRTVIIPSWLMTLERYATDAEYFSHDTGMSPAIYTVSFHGQTQDITEWEKEELLRYSQQHFSGIEGTTPDEESFDPELFYFRSRELDPKAPKMPSDTTVKLNYTGRRLDGQVFDTTIKDTAIVHNIYDKSRTYEPVSITMSANWSEITMSGSSSLINGFKGALFLMHVDEKATVAFGSSYGYSSSGSGSRIPAYAPLCFDLEIVPGE